MKLMIAAPLLAISCIASAAPPALQPFIFADLSTISPVSEQWLKSQSFCLQDDLSNKISCTLVMLQFTGMPVSANVTLVDRKLSELSFGSGYIRAEKARVSLEAKYGPACRTDVWCFKTGELRLSAPPSGWDEPGITINYNDTKNLEVKKPPAPTVDF